jgi:hypothetical protein
MTRTNRHLLCAYCFTSYTHYIYIAVPIQQGTHITDLLIYYFWGTIVCHIFGLPGCTNNNNIILALSNIYIIDKAKDFREKVKKRLAKTFTNSRIVRQVFGNNYRKELQIPCFIDNYNYYMGGVDLAN